VLAIAAFRQRRTTTGGTAVAAHVPVNPDERSAASARARRIEQEGSRNRYVLVTDPSAAAARSSQSAKGTGRYVVRARGRPAHAGGAHHKGKSAIRAMAEIILASRLHRLPACITTNVGHRQRRHRRQTSSPSTVRRTPTCACRPRRRGRDGAPLFRALAASDATVEITVTGGIHRPPFVRGPTLRL